MDTKVQKIKSKRQNNCLTVEGRCFTTKIADMAGCKPRNVQYFLKGERGKRGGKGTEKIRLAIALYEEGENQLISKIKTTINQNN